ncbi:MAG TPA: hypothetical protein VK708_08470 [Bryobacteraceae bacterium]|nr:hypothetical protein [Bryobacteraceae bacterium]
MATSTHPPESIGSGHAGIFGAAAVRGLARIATPSVSDCFFIALIVWLFISGASGWISLLGDGDTGWHIRTGQYILEQHSVPTRDLFSFSRPGAPWFAWEWLTDVTYAVSFQLGGLKAIVLLAGAMIALFATLILRYTLWRGANALVAAFTTLLAVGASSMHFLARPHLFTLLLLPVCLWVVEADRRENTRWLWALIPLTALWTNLHGGFVIFLACLGLLLLAYGIEMALAARVNQPWRELPGWPQIRRYATLLAGCSLASLANPYGYQLHVHILEYLRADWIKNIVQEFQAPTFRSEGQLQFEVLLLAGLIASGFLIRRRLFAEALWIVFLAHSSLISVRHAPLYATVAAPLIACEISVWWRAGVEGMKKSSALRILHQLGADLAPGFRRTSVWPALFILTLAVLDAPLKWPRDFPSEVFPTAMVHRHAGLVASGRLLTPDQWGDYIIYSFYPRQKVYVDGRSDFYGEKFGQEYLHLMQGAYDWRAIVNRNGFDVALLPVDWPLASMLKLDPSWRVVQDDTKVILFQRLSRQTPRN